jgi:oligopeptidase B
MNNNFVRRTASRFLAAFFFASIFVFSACTKKGAEPPTAEKKPKELAVHGDVRVDNYYWLRQRDNPEVIAYLEAENAYTESVLSKSSGLRGRLLEEMKSRIKQDDVTAPYKHGEYFYYQRYEEGLDYAIYCRRLGSMEAEEEVLLDVNKKSANEDYFDVQGFSVSPDHTLAAYAVDTVGRRFYTVRFINLETGAELPDQIENVTPNFEWAQDSRSFFYTKQHPETLRWQWIYRTRLGKDNAELVYEESDETFNTFVYKSLTGQFLYIASQSTLSTEAQYIPAIAPDTAPTVFLPREEKHEYFVTDGGDRFYIVSNDNAQNFQLLEAPFENTSKDAWKVSVAHRDDVLIENVIAFSNYLALVGRRGGLAHIEVIDRNNGESHSVDFGEAAYLMFPGDNYEFDTETFRYRYESMTTPDSVYDYDMSERERKLVKEQEVPGGFSRDDYETERLFATARDGTEIPISLVYRKGMEMNGQNPLLQVGYGSYGASSDPGFSSARLSLLERGFIVAIAHIRGGSEMGRHWYYEGRQLSKKNTFTDFIDVSAFLIDKGYTSPQHLYAAGGSAGGLLMGAVVNMAPNLYRGVLAAVPFVDVITTMLDESIPLTSGEFDEWGDPRKQEYYQYMLSYSPYDQVRSQAYPNLLVTTGLHDSQVQYWEPAKWVAKLRDYKTDDNILLFKTDMDAGHSGKTGRFQSLQDVALYYSFFLSLEGISE